MKTWLKVTLILGAIGALLAFMIVSEQRKQARLTAETSGTLTAVEFVEDEESSSLDETRFKYRYTAAGGERSGEDSLPGDRREDYRVGQTVPICFNPEDPSESDIRHASQANCGG